MTQALQKLVTFDEFVEFLQTQPDNICYELYDGEIIQVPLPTGDHEEIIAFLVKVLTLECHRRNLNYGIPKTVLVKPENKKAGYFPDVPLLNLPNLINESQWKKESTISNSDSIPLVIEVVSQCVARVPRVEATDEPVRVSTNWRDDYHKKLADYEEMGIQ
jgi:Uma2 family endonuclease